MKNWKKPGRFVARGGAFVVRNPEEMAVTLEKLRHPEYYGKAVQAVRGYLEESKGATVRILSFLKQILPENP